MLRVAFVAAFLFQAIPCWHVRANEPSDGLRLVLPKSPVTVRFGEPVLLPVSIANESEHPRLAPSFRMYSPALRVSVRCDGINVASHFGQSMRGGDAEVLSGGDQTSTILPVAVWSPAFFKDSADFRGEKKFLVHLLFSWSGSDNQPRQLSGQVQINVAGSVFSERGHKTLRQCLRDLRSTDANLHMLAPPPCPGMSPFWTGITPLSWLDWRLDNHESWWDKNSVLLKRASQMFEGNNDTLDRLRASVVLGQMFGRVDVEGAKQPVDLATEYASLVSDMRDHQRREFCLATSGLGKTIFPIDAAPPRVDRKLAKQQLVLQSPELKKFVPEFGYSY